MEFLVLRVICPVKIWHRLCATWKDTWTPECQGYNWSLCSLTTNYSTCRAFGSDRLPEWSDWQIWQRFISLNNEDKVRWSTKQGWLVYRSYHGIRYEMRPIVSQYILAYGLGSFHLHGLNATQKFKLPITFLRNGCTSQNIVSSSEKLRWFRLLPVGQPTGCRIIGHESCWISWIPPAFRCPVWNLPFSGPVDGFCSKRKIGRNRVDVCFIIFKECQHWTERHN